MKLVKLRNLAKGEVGTLIGGSTFLLLLRGTGAGVTFATHALLARWMGASELGTYVFAVSTVWVLAMVSGFGFPPSAVRFIPQNVASGRKDLAKGYVRRAYQIAISLSLLAAAGMALGLIVTGKSEPLSDKLPLYIACACVPFMTLLLLQASLARSILLLILAAVPNLVLRPLMLFLAVCGFYFADFALSAWTMMSLFFLILSAIGIGQFFLLQRRLSRELGNEQPAYETKMWLTNSAPLLVPLAFTAFFLELNLLVAGLFLPADQLAIYNVAFRAAELMGFFLRAVNFQFAPHASRLYGKGDATGFQRIIARAAQLRFWSIVVAFVALVLVGKFLLGIFGEQFVSGYTALMLFAGGKLILGAFGPLIQVVTITGNHNRCLPVFAASIVLSLGSSAILIPQYGIEGGAISVFVATLVANVWIYRIVVKRVRVDTSVLSLRLAFR